MFFFIGRTKNLSLLKHNVTVHICQILSTSAFAYLAEVWKTCIFMVFFSRLQFLLLPMEHSPPYITLEDYCSIVQIIF